MKRLVGKVILLGLAVVFFFASMVFIDLNVVGNQYLYNYQASILDEVERLKSIKEPKIILVGNSNVSFGFDSELMEKELGMPVVNTGIHAGLGNAFQENLPKEYISEGDIVLICHNSYSDDSSIKDPGLAWITIEKHRELLPILQRTDYRDMAQAYPIYALNCAFLKITGRGNQHTDSCYDRDAFNEYGDIVYKPESERESVDYIFHEGTVKVPDISDACADRINEYNRYVKEKGATLLVTGYPIGSGKFTPDAKKFKAFQNKLEKKLDCPIISDFTDFFIPYEYFYNTELHLTPEGVRIRTMQTVNDLKRWMQMRERPGER